MTTQPENLIAIIVSVLPATNHRCTRIKIRSPRFNKKKIISMKSSYKEETAIEYIAEHGATPIARANGEDGADILLYSFESVESVLKAFN